jgi:hypothetical protein
MFKDKAAAVYFIVLTQLLFSCSAFKKSVPANPQSLAKSLATEHKHLTIIFWGNVKSETETCHCDLFPLGGHKRKEKYLKEELEKEPKALLFNFGNLFAIEEKKEKKDNKQQIKAFKIENALPLSALGLNDADYAKLKSLGLEKECKQCALPSEVKTVPTPVGNIKVQRLNSSIKQSNPGELLNVFFNDMTYDETLASPFYNSPQSSNALILGAKGEGNDTLFCLPKSNVLFCYGTSRGRSMAKLDLYLTNKSDKPANWVELHGLEENLADHPNAKDGPTEESLGSDNFYKLEVKFMDNRMN